ncbi:Hepatocyte growth factor activator [Frankliniella fusca]|uniref:Hepatocyte growth factor activator n=1 Tax=Frankliniella fusca TaxID=407009 RepID=A0AAE1LJT4_9NEOP|nr:Hepatocyte growth factor activator [Frankliniella fusca]
MRRPRHSGRIAVALNESQYIILRHLAASKHPKDWYTCDICKKRQIYCRSEKKPCKDCHIYTSSNDLDPKDVPSELLDLTFVEQQVIARVHPVLSLYKVKNVHYKYLGQIINFPQNVQELCDILPNTVENLSGVLAIRCKDSDGFRDFFIRKQKVLNALVWLKANNPFYYDIQISQDRIDLLPDNGCIYNQVRGFNDDGEKSCSITDGDLVITVDDLPEMDSEEELIVYKDVPDLSYVSQKDQLNLNENVLVWPSIRRIPINEFSSPGYITMSFPYLFCWGTCDYSNRKDNTVSLHKYIEHLMLYKDGRMEDIRERCLQAITRRSSPIVAETEPPEPNSSVIPEQPLIAAEPIIPAPPETESLEPTSSVSPGQPVVAAESCIVSAAVDLNAGGSSVSLTLYVQTAQPTVNMVCLRAEDLFAFIQKSFPMSKSTVVREEATTAVPETHCNGSSTATKEESQTVSNSIVQQPDVDVLVMASQEGALSTPTRRSPSPDFSWLYDEEPAPVVQTVKAFTPSPVSPPRARHSSVEEISCLGQRSRSPFAWERGSSSSTTRKRSPSPAAASK